MNIKCNHCGANLLNEGVGESYETFGVNHGNGVEEYENGDFLEYYCPSCGEAISNELASKTLKELSKGENNG